VKRDFIEDGVEDQRWRAIALAPLLLAAALFLPSIGERLIYLGDEARYALLARNMLHTGDWLVPRIGSEVHLEKTPLFIWSIAALSLPRGDVTELTAVLPAALSGIAGVGMTVLLGRRMFGLRAGVLGGLVLATTWGFFWHARLALADMMVAVFVVAAAVAFWTAVEGGGRRRLPMAIFWLCLGLALSAKGPVGLLPVLPCAAFLVAGHGGKGLRELRPLTGLAVVAVVSVPWALAFALQPGTSYVQSVLVDDFLAPRLRGWRHPLEIFWALGPIGVGFLPWTPFLPSAVRHGWWRPEGDDTRRAFRLLVFWVLAYVIVITLTPHKRDRYLLPTYPALALMIGWLWDRWMTRPLTSALRLHGALWAAVATLLAAAVLLPLRPRPELAVLVPPTLGTKLLLAGLLLTAGALALAAGVAGRPRAMFLAICVPMALALAYETPIFVAGHNRLYDVKALAERLAQRAGPDVAFVTYRYQPLALQFYTGRTVTRARDVAELRSLIATGRPVYVVAEDRAWPELAAAGAPTWTVVDRAAVDGRSVSVRMPTERR
jgi:4-amino-4-deoxy-L-arabinose transferase-like glycosyltransferase